MWRKSWARNARTRFSPVYVRSAELASPWRWVSRAITTKRPVARASMAVGEWKTAAGSSALRKPGTGRSEEHTSELQSRLHLVCRLLLEKKKKSYKRHTREEVDRYVLQT